MFSVYGFTKCFLVSSKENHGLTVRKLLDDAKLHHIQVSRFCSMVCDSQLKFIPIHWFSELSIRSKEPYIYDSNRIHL